MRIKFELVDVIEVVFNCVLLKPHVNARWYTQYAHQRPSTLGSVSDRCNICKYYVNVIQRHHLRHQKVGRWTGRSCSTVACCFFLLRDIQFKNERQRRSAQKTLLSWQHREEKGSARRVNDWYRNYARDDFQTSKVIIGCNWRRPIWSAALHINVRRIPVWLTAECFDLCILRQRDVRNVNAASA